jgi:hypothetical protein
VLAGMEQGLTQAGTRPAGVDDSGGKESS